MSDELQELKEEVAQTNMRLDGVEGYFDNFDTTLNNHMNDYNAKLDSLRRFTNWPTGVQLALTGLAVSAVIATLLFVVRVLLERSLPNVPIIFAQ